MSGVLLDSQGNLLRSFTTDATKRHNGFRLEYIEAGDYCLKISDPNNIYSNSQVGIDNKFNSSSTYCFKVDDTTTDSFHQFPVVSAGFVASNIPPTYTIRGYSWIDTNNDGVSNPGEPWLDGMKGVLTDINGKVLQNFTTDASKAYDGFRFDKMPAGGYCLKITDPKGNYFTGPIGTDNKFNSTGQYCFSLDSTTVDASGILNIPSGFTPKPPPKYTIRGYSWIDSNSNGDDNPGEPWLGGMNGELTDSNGNLLQSFITDAAKWKDGFRFDNMTQGGYCLRITDPQRNFSTGPIGNDNKFNSNGQYCFSLDSTTVDSNGTLTIAAGFIKVPKYTIRGYSWIDTSKDGVSNAGEPWLGGMKGELTDINGKVLQNFTTDASKGFDGFRCENLIQGRYCLKITDPQGNYATGPIGTDNKFNTAGQYCFSLDSTTVDANGNLNIAAGFTKIPKYTVRGYSWIDTSNDGVSNAGEPWLGGMKGELTDINGKVLQNFTTDASKGYDGFRCENLLPGRYCLKITDPQGNYATGPIGTDNKFNTAGQYCFSLDSTTVDANGNLNIAAGFTKIPKYTIRGYSWIDTSKDGVSNPGEPWLDKIDGQLTDSNGNVLQNFTTEAAKGYDGFRLDNLIQGRYCIKLTDPKGAYVPSPIGADNKFDSTGQYCFMINSTTVDSSGNFNVPAGFVPVEYTIRGYSWIDTSKDGVSNSGEPWLGGMKGELTDKAGNVLKTFTTDASKFYDGFRLENITAGDYCIKMNDPQGTYVTGPIGADNKFDRTSKYCFIVAPTTVDSSKAFNVAAGFIYV
ncbi:hypothetical protein SAMD00019534_106400 [Acytostelium subglobosum LB1]|uniref:hypothetical protein n=1 Tax=Acytostelium subglobosum LB1 TaxID=1410327 RepID=UPI000644EB0C|nr:hypothetical protein SAMD00019534_106400 [Acytostelium subglobosum LB1]GAM27464.1 hypothetical protein SAMD00019534_106400 [Acytostelium subglobosum LB1]|eukprot:XP_012749529.1 hypothetical protein SAMD00019534_106400 [Acytostelium subglobosum LB1]